MCGLAVNALDDIEQEIKAALTGSSVVHFDETGFRMKNTLWWLHVACTDSLTVYFIHRKRGKVAMDAMNVLPQLNGIAVHDGLKSYAQYEVDHSLCNAHHLRELIFIAERYAQAWAEEMIALFIEMNQAVKGAKALDKIVLEPSQVEAFEKQYADKFLGMYNLKEEYVEIAEPLRETIQCEDCKKELLVPKGAMVSICEHCRYENILKKTCN